MLTIKNAVVRSIRAITFVMVSAILLLSMAIQIFSAREAGRDNARQIFSQVEQILKANTEELAQTREEYNTRCLNDARMVAYILEYNPAASGSVDELKKIAANAGVDEIHIFDPTGSIVAGTHPEYYGYNFDSGEQMNFFKPLLTDRSLELVQDVMPNTAEGKLVQYSALWSEDRQFIVQIGMYPSALLRVTEKNSLSYIFSLLRTGVGYSLYAIDPDTLEVVGSTVAADVGRDAAGMGFSRQKLEQDGMFHTQAGGASSCCLSRKIGENYVVWASPFRQMYLSVLPNTVMLLAALVLISVILVCAVSAAVGQDVIAPIGQIVASLRSIQQGDLSTKVDVRDSKEFQELSEHINGMVDSLLQSSEKLELSEQVQLQKEELERQHQQLEDALEQAQEASRSKSEFLFNMSHDIRTPMNAILGFTDLALECGNPETQKEYLKNIDESSRQLLDLINNILELSRIEHHEILVDEDLVNVYETCRKLSTIFDSDLKKKHLRYTVHPDFRHTYLYLDVSHYSRIFLNIVSNAIKYTPDGGAIDVYFTELPGDAPDTCFVETRIQDTGIGMSPEFLLHAYESFSRERTSTDSGLQGTGLGLAIVKTLVDALQGTISIESQQGRGTVVTVQLPHRIGEAPADKSPEEAPVDQALFQGKRILMAEDIDINAIIATKILSAKGFRVERAKDGVECVDMLLKAEGGYYDLVLMDIQMPVMDGYRAARAIRDFEDREKASIPILALTANAFKEDRDRAVEAGMNGHIAKPLNADTMFRTIAEVLGGASEADG